MSKPNPFDPATPTSLDHLLDVLTAAGVPALDAGLAPLFTRLRTTLLRYLVTPAPCPSTAFMNTTPPTPGQGYTYNFGSATLPFYYTLTVINVTTDKVVFQEKKYFTSADPLQFAIPAKIGATANDTFVADAEYTFILQPTLVVDGKDVAIGCVQDKTHSTSVVIPIRLVFAALALWKDKKC